MERGERVSYVSLSAIVRARSTGALDVCKSIEPHLLLLGCKMNYSVEVK